MGGTWDAPATIDDPNDTSDFSVTSANIAMNALGTAMVVWAEYDGSVYDVWSNRYVGGDWETPTLAESIDWVDAIEPVAVVDRAGGALVAWYQKQAYRNEVWANRFVPGEGWRTEQLLGTNYISNTDDMYPKLVIDSNDHAFLIVG